MAAVRDKIYTSGEVVVEAGSRRRKRKPVTDPDDDNRALDARLVQDGFRGGEFAHTGNAPNAQSLVGSPVSVIAISDTLAFA